MSLKSLIQRLLDSRTTPEEAGHSAMPSPTEVSLTPSVTSKEEWGDVCTGTASSDGYIRMNFGATSSEAIGSARSFGAVAFSTPQKTGDIVSVICPVAKGKAYAMSVRNANNITCAFVKLIGASVGGVQAVSQLLLQGDVLCRLSRLYSSLRRSSLLAKRNGSEVKVFSQTQIPEQRSLLTTLRLRFIRLQVMDGLHSAETGHRPMSALPESWERVALTLKVISELQLRFGRGMPLVSIARQTISNRLRQNSFPAKGLRNTSLVGGASC